MGREKATLAVGGLPLWRRQWEALEKAGASPRCLSLRRPLEWIPAGAAVVLDEGPESGPLGGICAALRWCEHRFLLVLAVDMPDMEPAYLRGLGAEAVPGCGVVPLRRSGLFEPLAALYPREFLALAERSLQAGQLSLQAACRQAVAAGLLNPRPVSPAEERLFHNWNQPGDIGP